MSAFSGLVLAAMLFPSPAAQAGSWTYTVTGDNTGSAFTDSGVSAAVPAYSPASSSGSGISAGASFVGDRPNNGPSGVGCDINRPLA